jgi:outer membrane beta-barrel protein
MKALLVLLAFATPAVAQESGGGGGGFDFGETPPASPTDNPAPDKPADAAKPGDSGTPAASANPEGESKLDEAINLTLKDRIKAVSRKVFLKEGRFEFQPAVGVTTNDPFFRTWSINGRVAYHLNDAFALEIGGAYAPSYLREKLPELDQLRHQARLINDDAPLIGLADAGITFSPIYGKVAILSDAIIHFDAFAIAGAGTIFDENATFVHPTMDVGAGLRVFLLRWLVVRTDLRDYIYPQDRSSISTLQNLLMLSMGVGFYFPFDFEYRYEAARVKS